MRSTRFLDDRHVHPVRPHGERGCLGQLLMRRRGPSPICGRRPSSRRLSNRGWSHHKASPRRCKDAAGRWRYLDVDSDDYQLVAEVDGQQHMEALAWGENMERNHDVVVEDGKTLLRFAGFALRRQPRRVAGVLRRFFDRHPSAGRSQ